MGRVRRRAWIVLALVALGVVVWLLQGPLSTRRTSSRADSATREIRNSSGESHEAGESEFHSATAAWKLRVLVLFRGKPVSGARVEIFGPRQEQSWARVTPGNPAPAARAVTNDDGRAALPAQHAGWWNIVARRAGHAAGRVGTMLLDPPQTREVVVRLRRGWTLRGRVLDETGRPVPDAQVTAGTALNGRSRHANVTTRTDPSGRYRLADLPPGTLQVAPGDPMGHWINVVGPLEGDCDLVLRRCGSLAGRVTDAGDDRPLSGVSLRVEARGSIGYCVTDERGSYRCDGLRPGAVRRIAVAAPGYVPLHPSGVVGPKDGSLSLDPAGQRGRVTLSIPIRAGETTSYDIALRKGARVTGIVRGPKGPIAGAQVHLLTNLGQNGYLVAPVVTDGTGRYRFEGVLDGPVLVRPSKAGYFDPRSSRAFWKQALQGRREAPNRVVVPREGVVEHDLELTDGVELRGTVTADGASVTGVFVYTHQARPLDRHRNSVVAADGSFLVRGLIPGHPVRVWSAGVGFAPSKSLEFELSANPDPLQFHLDLLPIVRGRVTDASGAPVPGATILIVQQIAWSVSREPVPVLTDVQGRYARRVLGREHPFQIEVRASGYPRVQSDSISIVAGQSEYQVDVALDRGATLRGMVRTPEGTPVPNAMVRVGRERENQYSWFVPVKAITGADGTFVVSDVPTPRLTLFVSAPGYRPVRSVVPSDDEAVVTLEPTSRIRGVVRRRDGTAASGVAITAYPADGQRFDIYFKLRSTALRSDGIPGPAHGVSDERGHFVVMDLGTGPYRLAATAGSGQRVVGDVVARAGSEGVVLTVEPASGGVFGSLTDEDAGSMARYLGLRGEHAKAVEVWRDLLGRELGATTRATVLVELARSLGAAGNHAEREAAAQKATALAPASTDTGLFARYELARAILAQDRAQEALTLANEVASGKAVSAAAAARGDLVAVLALIELGEIDAARTRLDRVGHEAQRLNDASLQVLVRNAVRELNRKR